MFTLCGNCTKRIIDDKPGSFAKRPVIDCEAGLDMEKAINDNECEGYSEKMAFGEY